MNNDQNEKWKLDMLRKMWGGEEDDPEKDQATSPSSRKKTSRPVDQKWPSIDLHRYRELSRQLLEAEKAIDRAITEGHNGIIIIHGKGEGKLRAQLIRELKSQPHILDYSAVNDGQGESGALKIRFK